MYKYQPSSPQRTVLGERDVNQSVPPVSSPTRGQVSHATQTIGDENAIPSPAKEVKKATKIAKKNANKLLDVSEIHLDGEESDQVPVFDTCDEVRRKIRAFLRKDGVTQAALLRALGKCRSDGGPISSSSFRMFMNQKGPSAGGHSLVLYCGYVFFEKVRLRDGKPKSKKRQEMEEVWGPGGVSFGSRYVICHEDEIPVIDQYGQTQFLRR